MSSSPPHPGSSDRYQRQSRLRELGKDGQLALTQGHAIIVGMGALGCVVGDHLARAGVGRLTIIDRDTVEWSNLQRQSLYTEQDALARAPKVEIARRRLLDANSSIQVEAIVADVNPRNVERLLAHAFASSQSRRVLIDGTDNFELRFLLNDLAVKHGLPLVYAGVVGMVGTTMTIIPGRTPCLRCLGEMPPPASTPTCEMAGVFAPAVGAVASLQAADALRLLALGVEDVPPSLLCLDVWRRSCRILDSTALGPRPDCPCCARRNFEHLNAKGGWGEASLCGQDAVQVSPRTEQRLDLAQLAARWAGLGRVTLSTSLARVALSGEMHAHEITVFSDGRAIVRGTSKPDVARTIYARYVGA